MLVALLTLLLQEAPKEEEFLAIRNVRALTVTKGDLEGVTILVKNGKIAEIGKDVKVPEGATVIDGKGLVAMPGFVNAYSLAGGGRGFGGGGGSNPHHLAYDEFDPTGELFEQLPRTGFTSFGVYPQNGVISGQGIAVKLNGLPKESMVVAKTAFLRIGMRAETSAKDLLRREFEAARKVIEAEKKYEEEKKKYEEEKKKREDEEKKKKEEKKKEETKDEKKNEKKEPVPQEPKPPPKADPKVQVLVDFLKGELPGLVQTSSAGEIAHFWQVLKDVSGVSPRLSYVATPDAYKAIEGLGERKAWVVLRPQLAFAPFTRDRINPAAELARAGVKVALAPAEDSFDAYESFLFQVAELVKFGFDREAALKSFTIHPAEMLGLEKQLGSLEAGKDGDIVLLSGDPLGSMTKIVRVVVGGRVIFGEGNP